MSNINGKYIIFLMNRWASSAGGIQTVNRNLACSVKKQNPQLNCVCVATFATEEERKNAASCEVQLIAGNKEDDWTFLLSNDALNKIPKPEVLAVIGHSTFSGHIAASCREKFTSAILVQFVYTIPFRTEGLKEYRKNSYIEERERRSAEELNLAEAADLVAAIGPRINRYIKHQLDARRWKC